MKEITLVILSKRIRHFPSFLRFILRKFLTIKDCSVQGGLPSIIKFQEKRKTLFTA